MTPPARAHRCRYSSATCLQEELPNQVLRQFFVGLLDVVVQVPIGGILRDDVELALQSSETVDA
jgi:hypothetical protein